MTDRVKYRIPYISCKIGSVSSMIKKLLSIGCWLNEIQACEFMHYSIFDKYWKTFIVLFRNNHLSRIIKALKTFVCGKIFQPIEMVVR